MSGSIETMPTQPSSRSPKCRLPSLPPRDAAAAAHVVGEVAVGGHAADEVRAEVAVQDAHPVARAEHVRRADRDRLLAAAVVEAAGDLSLPVERDPALLGGAHHRHVPQQVGAVGPASASLARRPVRAAHARPHSRAGSLATAPLTGFISLRPSCLADPSGSPRDRPGSSPLRDLLRGAYGRRVLGVPPSLPMSGSVRAAGPCESLSGIVFPIADVSSPRCGAQAPLGGVANRSAAPSARSRR